jgi:GAF domain-containing protein
MEDNHDSPYLPDYEHYVEVLGSGGVIAGKASDFGEVDRRDLLDEGILATAFVPIFVAGEWWGYLASTTARPSGSGAPPSWTR